MKQNLAVRFLPMMVLLAGLQQAAAQPTIVSTVPANGVTGVSPSATVVFTFSTAMDTDATTATFFDFTVGFTPLPVDSTWSAGNTVLTCTPSPAFANNHTITWVVSGQDTNENELGGLPEGSFTTGSAGGGGGGGSGTNAITSFVLGKLWYYNQTNTAAPTLDPDNPYFFSASTSLASNRTATAVMLTFPNTTFSNLQTFVEPEDYFLYGYSTNLTIFNASYPAGNYAFTVASNSASQQAPVTLPASQPNAPHISNYTAAQTVNPTQAFTLTWDAFSGGTSADYIFVSVDDQNSGTTIFESPEIGSPNSLKGTATLLVIPANTLQANSNYDATIGFFRGTITTNSAGKYITEGYLATLTQFTISTSGSSVAAAPVLTNAVWNAGTFGFDILTSSGQTLTVVYNTNLTKAVASWPILLTTNSPGNEIHISDPHSKTNKSLFYRARNGI